ncbi:MAG: hypothetical protein ACI9B8_003021 [Sulfitobacter sp.]|jgi:hypothetical protein
MCAPFFFRADTMNFLINSDPFPLKATDALSKKLPLTAFMCI